MVAEVSVHAVDSVIGHPWAVVWFGSHTPEAGTALSYAGYVEDGVEKKMKEKRAVVKKFKRGCVPEPAIQEDSQPRAGTIELALFLRTHLFHSDSCHLHAT